MMQNQGSDNTRQEKEHGHWQTVTWDARQENIKKLNELIKGINIAMLVTEDEQDGSLRSRPMATQKLEFDGTLWFFTDADSPKVDDIHREWRVNVSYADAGKNTYVSVSGLAKLNRDRTRIDQYWNDFLKTWWPKGKDDPNLALLEVEVTDAHYWDGAAGIGGFVQVVIGFVQAVTTGEPAEDMGDEGKLKFN